MKFIFIMLMVLHAVTPFFVSRTDTPLRCVALGGGIKPTTTHLRPETSFLPVNLPLRPQAELAPAPVQLPEAYDRILYTSFLKTMGISESYLVLGNATTISTKHYIEETTVDSLKEGALHLFGPVREQAILADSAASGSVSNRPLAQHSGTDNGAGDLREETKFLDANGQSEVSASDNLLEADSRPDTSFLPLDTDKAVESTMKELMELLDAAGDMGEVSIQPDVNDEIPDILEESSSSFVPVTEVALTHAEGGEARKEVDSRDPKDRIDLSFASRTGPRMGMKEIPDMEENVNDFLLDKLRFYYHIQRIIQRLEVIKGDNRILPVLNVISPIQIINGGLFNDWEFEL